MTPARRAEAERVHLVYYWALQVLGNAMTEDAITLWKGVPTTEQAATSAWWLARLLQLLFGFRREAQDLAVAYYRLERALLTGYAPTIGDEKAGETTTLEQLRQEFEEIVDDIDEQTSDSAPWEPDPGDPEPVDEDAEIELEYVTDISKVIEASDEAALEEAGERLDELGIENFLGKLKEIDEADESREKLIEAAHAAAGNRQAAAAMRIMQNAARGLVYDLGSIDARVIAYVRYSKTGTPCGWCAMLISRGVVYKSKRSATKASQGAGRLTSQGRVVESDLYHDNCRCVAVPIFILQQYDYGDMFALNRELEDLWDDLADEDPDALIRQYGTAEILAIFRKIMRQRKAQSDAVQAAA